MSPKLTLTTAATLYMFAFSVYHRESAAGKIPPPSSAAGEAGVGAGITKLSLDKKVKRSMGQTNSASRAVLPY